MSELSVPPSSIVMLNGKPVIMVSAQTSYGLIYIYFTCIILSALLSRAFLMYKMNKADSCRSIFYGKQLQKSQNMIIKRPFTSRI